MQRRRLVLAGILVAVALAGFLAYLTTIPFFDCGDTVIIESTSRAAGVIATAFTDDCGATTRAVTWVNLRRLGKSFDRDDPFVFAYDDVIPVSLRWIDSSTLEIRYTHKAKEPYQKQRRWHDVKIVYRVDGKP